MVMDPEKIARSLICLAAETEPRRFKISDTPLTLHDLETYKREFGENVGQARLVDKMKKLDKALDEAGWDPDLSDIPPSARDHWTLGEAITLESSSRPIRRGFVTPMWREPILRRIPDRIALYLITIDRGKDYLDRENHNMGWHYHYLDWRKRRSNMILSWDTRWTAPKAQTGQTALRGLFIEPHGEKKNADFVAKPHLWGAAKRQTVYDACAPDLKKWKIEEFKCASDDGKLIHPPGMTLTPHPHAIAAAVAKAEAVAKLVGRYRR